MPRWSAVGEYQTSTSVESVAATRSTGLYCEKPVRIAARRHCGSSSAPSTTTVASMRGGRTERSPQAAVIDGRVGTSSQQGGGEDEHHRMIRDRGAANGDQRTANRGVFRTTGAPNH
jgi:hypothetical protein